MNRLGLSRLVPRWQYLLATALATCGVSLLIGFLVRRDLQINHGFWLLQPYLYIRPGAHVEWPGFWPEIAVWTVTVIFAGIVLVALPATDRHSSRASLTVAVLGGLAIGGAIANSIEIATLGSVTDFLGIPTAGIYSAGDVGLDLGVALLPVAVYQLYVGRPTRTRLAVGLGVAILDLLYAISSGRPGLLVAYLLVPVAVLAGLLLVATRRRADRFQGTAGR